MCTETLMAIAQAAILPLILLGAIIFLTHSEYARAKILIYKGKEYYFITKGGRYSNIYSDKPKLFGSNEIILTVPFYIDDVQYTDEQISKRLAESFAKKELEEKRKKTIIIN